MSPWRGAGGPAAQGEKAEGRRSLQPSARRHLVLDVEAALLELFLVPLAAIFLDDAAVEEMDAAIGVARVTRIVRDHADRRAFAVQLAQQLHDRFAVLRVEVTGR